MKTLLLQVLVLFSLLCNASESNAFEDKVSEEAPRMNYMLWKQVLDKFVDVNGRVDYAGLKRNPKEFNAFVKKIQNWPLVNGLEQQEIMAFWINVYNVFAIKLVLDNYPLNSIKEVSKPWDTKFFTIGGREMSLGMVEHEILRDFGDARIHFAINCASMSCPPIAKVPYTSRNLDKLLEKQTRKYINNSVNNKITNKEYKLSQLFKWFKKDFVVHAGSVKQFINNYSTVKIGKQSNAGYIRYNWDLNEK